MWKPVSLLMLLLISSHGWAARSTGTMDMNRWLDQIAGPQLAEKLARHPKFKGAAVAFAPAQHNQLAGAKNQLYQHIEQVLSHRILSAGSNNIVSATNTDGCLGLRNGAQYVIGIQISSPTGALHHVQIKVLDHNSGVWVSGISFRWQGQLSRAQISQLNHPAKVVADGSVSAPYASHQVPEVARHLLGQIRCTLPAGVDGLIFLHNKHPAAVATEAAAISREVQQQLQTRPQWIFTKQRSEANWIMELEQERASRQMRLQWVILMTPAASPQTPQILASSYIGEASVNPVSLPDTDLRLPLLGELSWKPGKRCTNKQLDCVEITLDVKAEAYVMLFRTHNRRLQPASCDATSQLRKPGELRYQISLPQNTTLPTGIYAVASQDKQTFNRLRKHIQAAPGSCLDSTAPVTSWLTAAGGAINDDKKLSWQSLHLQHVGGSTRAIRETQ